MKRQIETNKSHIDEKKKKQTLFKKEGEQMEQNDKHKQID